MSKSLSRYCKYMNLDNLLWNMNFIFILGSINSAQRFVFEKSQNYWVVFLQFLHPLRSAMIHYWVSSFSHLRKFEFHVFVSNFPTFGEIVEICLSILINVTNLGTSQTMNILINSHVVASSWLTNKFAILSCIMWNKCLLFWHRTFDVMTII